MKKMKNTEFKGKPNEEIGHYLHYLSFGISALT